MWELSDTKEIAIRNVEEKMLHGHFGLKLRHAATYIP